MLAAMAFSMAASTLALNSQKTEPATPIASSLAEERVECFEVWSEGRLLPADYDGCWDGQDFVVAIEDAQGRVWFQDRFKAERGKVINR